MFGEYGSAPQHNNVCTHCVQLWAEPTRAWLLVTFGGVISQWQRMENSDHIIPRKELSEPLNLTGLSLKKVNPIGTRVVKINEKNIRDPCYKIAGGLSGSRSASISTEILYSSLITFISEGGFSLSLCLMYTHTHSLSIYLHR